MKANKSVTWLQWLANLVVVASTATVITVACAWCGFKLWSFSKKPPAPKKPSTSLSCPLERPSEKETLPEEGDSTSLTAGSQGTSRLAAATENVESLTFNVHRTKMIVLQEGIRQKNLLLQEKKERLTLSYAATKEMEREWNSLRELGASQADIEKDPNFKTFVKEVSFQNKLVAKILRLQNQVEKAEAKLPALEAAARVVSQGIQISSSSRRSNEISRIGSPGPSDSEIPRIEERKD